MFMLSARGIHDNIHPDQGNDAACYIESVRAHAVNQPAPQKGQDDKDTAVCGIDFAERGLRLERGHYSVENEDNGAANKI